jgi:hypothetical protein
VTRFAELGAADRFRRGQVRWRELGWPLREWHRVDGRWRIAAIPWVSHMAFLDALAHRLARLYRCALSDAYSAVEARETAMTEVAPRTRGALVARQYQCKRIYPPSTVTDTVTSDSVADTLDGDSHSATRIT